MKDAIYVRRQRFVSVVGFIFPELIQDPAHLAPGFSRCVMWADDGSGEHFPQQGKNSLLYISSIYKGAFLLILQLLVLAIKIFLIFTAGVKE